MIQERLGMKRVTVLTIASCEREWRRTKSKVLEIELIRSSTIILSYDVRDS